jgi:glyoxylase-like metal-dependent hydrolase (beta-lactamase superfamily II)
MCPLAASRLVGAGAMVCHVLLVETERDGLLLVDTGFGSRDCATPRRVPAVFRALVRPRLDPAQTAAAQVRALGYRLDDVRHVVITHLDLDHAGGLHDFPAAAVHLHRPEYLAAIRRESLADRMRYLTRQWEHGPRWVTYAAEGDTWMGLPAVRGLDGVRDEIALVPLVGHTRGHSGLAVKDGDRWLIHAGDAFFHRDELRPGGKAPIGLRAFATMDEVDRAARLASVEALRGLAARDDVTVVCSHDPVLLATAAASGRRPAAA